MWLDLLSYYKDKKYTIYDPDGRGISKMSNVFHSHFLSPIRTCLNKKWPFFFELPEIENTSLNIKLVDENPLTNKGQLSSEEMLKHMTLTYRLIGDRSMSHQLVRHRLCAFSQESQRYCNYGKKGFQIIVPPSVDNAEPIYDKGQYNIPYRPKRMFIFAAVEAYEEYLMQIEAGVKPEDARGLLPNCTKTEVITTCTLGNWMHIFKHRADNPKAQWQIRDITRGIKEHMSELLPQLFVS
jgi:thymidylate synthase (FAD)